MNCPRCHRYVYDGRNYCLNCGADIPHGGGFDAGCFLLLFGCAFVAFLVKSLVDGISAFPKAVDEWFGSAPRGTWWSWAFHLVGSHWRGLGGIIGLGVLVAVLVLLGADGGSRPPDNSRR